MSESSQGLYSRCLNAEDAQEFRAIRLEAITKTNVFVSLFPSVPNISPKQVEAEQPLSAWEELLVPHEHSSFFGVFDGDRLVAISAAHTAQEDTSGKSVGFGSAYVLDDYRRQGVVTLLFEAMTAWAAERKFERIICQCRKDNEPIKRFLRKSEFVQTGIEIGRMCSGEIVEGFRMERPVTKSASTCRL
ncbi:MAG: GNAT family N-acetyltransferase [Alphaproteobacteria bacterium]|nr:GNAT family N-acetyltransferase [Alphaproteobacteria bacterium]